MFDWPNDGPQHTRTKNSAVKSKYSNVCVFFFLHLLASIHPSPNKGKTEWARNPTRRHYFFFLKKAEEQWVRAGPHRTYISIPTAGRCYLLPNKITKSRQQKKNIRGIRTGIYYYFLFFFISLS